MPTRQAPRLDAGQGCSQIDLNRLQLEQWAKASKQCWGKRAFDTAEDAWDAAVANLDQPHSRKIRKSGLHTYRCPHCNLWHLTRTKPH